MIEYSLDTYPKVVLLSLEKGDFLIFLEITMLISKGAVPICTLTSNAGMEKKKAYLTSGTGIIGYQHVEG